jgi:hypothetical protein
MLNPTALSIMMRIGVKQQIATKMVPIKAVMNVFFALFKKKHSAFFHYLSSDEGENS